MAVKFVFIARVADIELAIRDYVQRQIVTVGDLQYIDLLYIVTEGSVIFQLLYEKKIVIFSLGYLAHVSYEQSKAILTFLEQALLESKHR